MPQITEADTPSPSLRYYACGEVDQQLAHIFKDQQPEVRTFPAGVFLYEHTNGERVLFDTGYSSTIYHSGLRTAAYSKIMRPRISIDQEIASQLVSDKIEPQTIGRVVLSHLHPDHIGGVKFFPDAQFILSQEADRALRKPRQRDWIFRNLLPDWFKDSSKLVLDDEKLSSSSNGLIDGYSLFDQDDFLLTRLPGHAAGQIGALIGSQLLLAADAAWAKDLLPAAQRTRLATRLVNHDTEAYRTTASRLEELEAEGIELCFSHSHYDKKVLLP